MPPCFWASAVPLIETAISSAPAGATARRLSIISVASPYRLFVEPDVFHAPAVVDAVDHDRQSFDLGSPTDPAAVVVDDRPGIVRRQLPFDFPSQLLALLAVGLHRLPVNQLVHLGIAVAVVGSYRTAGVVLVRSEERRVGKSVDL